MSDLLNRPIYGIGQVERLLTLKTGTVRRWLQGYRRAGRLYPPVIRPETNDDEIVTWGEFVETRLLAEFRDAGVPLVNLRPAIIRLRDHFDTRFPLATARPFLDVAGRELVYRAQAEVALDSALQLIVIRNDQFILSASAAEFVRSIEFQDDQARCIRPLAEVDHVVIDPLRQFGEPVVRSVPTAVIAEQLRAGEPIRTIAELYELTEDEIEAALRYELLRSREPGERAA